MVTISTQKMYNDCREASPENNYKQIKSITNFNHQFVNGMYVKILSRK